MIIGLLVAGLVIMMVAGIPVAFALLGISTLLLVGFYGPAQLYILLGSFTNQLQSEVLLSIPLFVLMASFLQMSGIGADIYETMHKWLGGVKGGLAMATVAATSLIAAMSGVAATGTISMGLIALPEMLKRKYDKYLAMGPILAGGALGPIIPPSTIMIIVGAYSSVSTGKLFIGGIVPGLLLALSFCAYIALRCAFNPSLAPAVPREERAGFIEKLASLRLVIAPVGIVVLVLGVIYAGVCTPTEAAGVGAFSALAYTVVKRRLSGKALKEAVCQTTLVSTMLMWIMMCGSAYSSLVNITRMGDAIAGWVTAINMSSNILLLLILIIVAILGMFIDATAIIMITLPIFIPLIVATGLDLFTTMLLFSITICLGMITPPFGVNLFYLKSITPEGIVLNDIYKAAIPYAILFFAVVIVFSFLPDLLNWLPGKMFQ